MRLGIFGGLGKLGKAVFEAASAHSKIHEVIIKDTNDALSLHDFLNHCDVYIDASSAQGTQELCHALSRHRAPEALKPLVIASTGHTVNLETFVSSVSKYTPVMYLPNAALSVWHVLQCATVLSQRLGDAWDLHVEEHHHKEKKDAPSGTVVAFVAALESACPWLKGRISTSAIRGGRGMIENTLIFSGDHETIRLSHQALSRTVFAKGLIEAALWVRGQYPKYYTIEDYLQSGSLTG